MPAPRTLLHAFFDGGEQLVERFLEKLHAFISKLVGHLLHRNPGTREVIHRAPRSLDIFFQARAHAPVVAKRVAGRGRNRIDRIWSDQLLDVEHVADTPDSSCWCWPTERAASVPPREAKACHAGRQKILL